MDPSHIDGLVQDCSNSSALAIELLQSCDKPSMYQLQFMYFKYVRRSIKLIREYPNLGNKNFNPINSSRSRDAYPCHLTGPLLMQASARYQNIFIKKFYARITYLKNTSAQYRPFCPRLNVLNAMALPAVCHLQADSKLYEVLAA